MKVFKVIEVSDETRTIICESPEDGNIEFTFEIPKKEPYDHNTDILKSLVVGHWIALINGEIVKVPYKNQCADCVFMKHKPSQYSRKCKRIRHGRNPMTKQCDEKLTQREWENRDVIKAKMLDEMTWENVFVLTDGRYIPIPTEEIWDKYQVGDVYDGKHYTLMECSQIRRGEKIDN